MDPRGLSAAAQCAFCQAAGGCREGLRGGRSWAPERDAVHRGGTRGGPGQHGGLCRFKVAAAGEQDAAHYVKARVKVREYPHGKLAVFHGPRCLCRYDQQGRQIAAPTPASLASCSTPSRRGLEAPPPAARPARRPALTASRPEADGAPWVGTKKRALRSNKETGLRARFF